MKQFKTEYMDEHCSVKPKKKKNEHNRVRNTHFNFRVKPEVKEMIIQRAELLGLTRQEFMEKSCLGQPIVTVGNVKTFRRIQIKLDEVIERLDALSSISELDSVEIQAIRDIVDIYAGLKTDN